MIWDLSPTVKRRVGIREGEKSGHGSSLSVTEAMFADSLGMGANSLEPLGFELTPLPEGPQGNDDFWIDMAREEMAAIQRRADEDKLAIKRACAVRHKKSSEQKDAIIIALTKELEATRATALHWQKMYKSKAPAKELEELKKHVAQAEASTTTVIERLRVQVDHLQMQLRAFVGPLVL